MKTLEIEPVDHGGPMYASIYDKDDRVLIIDDERGGRVTLRGAEIGELFQAIKPPLMG